MNLRSGGNEFQEILDVSKSTNCRFLELLHKCPITLAVVEADNLCKLSNHEFAYFAQMSYVKGVWLNVRAIIAKATCAHCTLQYSGVFMNANEERIMRDASKTAKSLGISVEEVLNFATIVISGMPEASADMFSTCSKQIDKDRTELEAKIANGARGANGNSSIFL